MENVRTKQKYRNVSWIEKKGGTKGKGCFRAFFCVGEREAEKSVPRLDRRRRIPVEQKREVSKESDGRGGSRRARWTRKKQSPLYPVFQMESSKPNTSYLCVPRPRGKADEGTAEIASRS